MSFRWILLLVGIGLLLFGWFSSDEGVAREKRRQKRLATEDELGETAANVLYPDRDLTARERVGGGIDRFYMLLAGAALVAIAIFWNWLGSFFTGLGFEVVQ